MAFAQNIVADRRRRIHSHASCPGRCVCAGRAAVELPSPGSRCDQTKLDTAAGCRRHGIAQSHATIGRCRGPSDRHTSCDGIRPT